MNDLMVFNNVEVGKIRSVQIDGKIYFVGKDIASALGYKIPSKAINTHCKGVSKMEIPFVIKKGGLKVYGNSKI